MIKIEVQHLSLGYARREVVRDVTFQVHPGEMVGLIGPNGCGKSTIIRAVTRVIPPYRGQVLLNGRDIAGIPRPELARMIGVVPQMPLLPSAFTAFEIVLMGRNPHLGLFQHEGQKEIEFARHAMKRTMTHHLARRRVGELSGGEIQCLLVARVLAQETEAILLDEPTANLDIGRQVEILDLVKNLCRTDHTAILVALHDLNLAAQYCDRLVLVNNGQVFTRGTPAAVITPENMKEVYGADECVYRHPANGLPAILLKAGGGQASGTKNIMKKR
ncbi:MAG: ABC transporter ATP-binding protein [Chloroflexota bacterium]